MSPKLKASPKPTAEPAKPPESTPLNPAQKASIAKIGARLEARNAYKLAKSEKTGGYCSAENNPAMAIVQAMEATGAADQDAANRLIVQAINAQPEVNNLENANSAIALMQGLGPQDELEGMLAAQMVAVHNMSLEYARRAMNNTNLSTDGANAMIARTTKLMGLFTRQIEALQRYRTKGQQKIVVQHVQVGEGGQAIIGDVHQGGGRG